MWIFTKDGFFSAVEDRKDPLRVIVRARDKRDIVRLAERIGVKAYKSGENSDYEYRLWASKLRWAEYLSMSAARIDYSNFKDAMGRIFDSKRMEQLHTVWAVMAGYFGVEEEKLYEEEDDAALRFLRERDAEKSRWDGFL